MVYGIPSHLLSLSNQVVFIVLINLENNILTSSPSALLEYFDRFKSFFGQ